MAAKIILNGLRSIEECLRVNPDRIAKLYFERAKLSPRLEAIKKQAEKAGVRVEITVKNEGDEGCSALLSDYQYTDFDDFCAQLKSEIDAGERPCVLMLDGVTDPQNLGAILRTAAFMNVAGVVLPKDRASPITDTVYRVASGGLEYVPVCQVPNLVSAMARLKECGFWSVGFSEHAKQTLAAVRRDIAPLLVIGNEEKGIRPLVRENCDFLAKFEGRGKLASLNASVAAALAMQWAVSEV